MPASREAGISVSGLVLAGGASWRMGRPKAQLPYRGGTFLAAVLDLLRRGGCTHMVVVLGHDAEALRAACLREPHPDTRVVVNTEWEQGQFTSVQAGLRALEAATPPRPDACLLALVDQPHIPESVPRALIDRFQATRAPLIRPTFEGRGGHPVLIAATLIPEILALPPTATLYEIFQRHATRRLDVPVAAPQIREDFDLPEDLERLT